MGLLAQLDRDAAELYLRRFCAFVGTHNLIYSHKKYAPIVSFCELDWSPIKKSRLILVNELVPLARLDASHFNLVQLNREAWTNLLLWFPPYNEMESDEARLLVRAGVKFSMGSSTVASLNLFR